MNDLAFKNTTLKPLFSTADDIHAFIQSLPNDCQKRRMIESWCDHRNFWQTVDHQLTILSIARRTHCKCHKVGSYTPKDPH